MKNLVFLLTAIILGTGTSFGASMGAPTASFGTTRAFIFTEADVTFSVYPDGEFDFYLGGQFGAQAGVFGGQGAITYNSGFNYNPYVQYDDYGAVIQIAQLPVFYDYYGRVSRIGNIHMNYRSGRLYRLGGMRIYYNGFGYYNYHVGYINPYNRVYVYQPFHRYFVRPAAGFCMCIHNPTDVFTTLCDIPTTGLITTIRAGHMPASGRMYGTSIGPNAAGYTTMTGRSSPARVQPIGVIPKVLPAGILQLAVPAQMSSGDLPADQLR